MGRLVLRSRSPSVTIPMTRPSTSVTGRLRNPRRNNSDTASDNSVSGFTETTLRCMISATGRSKILPCRLPLSLYAIVTSCTVMTPVPVIRRSAGKSLCTWAGVSTHSILSGKPADSASIAAVWMRPSMLKPASPRITVAPEAPSRRSISKIAAYAGLPPYLASSLK